MTSAIQSIFPSNYSEEEIEPVGTQSTCKPEERLTLNEWLEYIKKLVQEDYKNKNSPKPKNDE